jgi:lysyl-tRNA synthetase class 1
MYHAGKFDRYIEIALNHAEAILDIYQKVSGSKKREKGWLPLQVVCEKCGRLGTTRVHNWDGKTVTYTCEPEMVTWAAGCGYTGRISPFGGNGKLPWKVDWPAHWSVMGVTIEGAGKDHSSAGGSRDIARELCHEVFDIPEPFNLPYEFFLIGGKKMSSSKGLGLKARNLTEVLPAAVARFLFTRTDYRQAIEFDPEGTMAMPDLFDEYDRCYEAYISGSDVNLARTFILSQIDNVPDKAPVFLPRFRDVANYCQLASTDLEQKFTEIKGSPLSHQESEILKEREKYARVWLDRYAPDEYRIKMTERLPDDAKNLPGNQKLYLSEVIGLLKSASDADKLQSDLYALSKTLQINPKDAFAALYLTLLGKTHGPKAAWLILQYPKSVITERLEAAISGKSDPENDMKNINLISKPEIFRIDPAVKESYPSVSIGIAVISGVKINKSDKQLDSLKSNLLIQLKGLTTEKINEYPEVLSYRKLYKQMGVDWHSRRPSPEALLRRIAQGKELYTVNTCVDAYNLAVIQNRVSVGAFDLDNIVLPTSLRFAGEGDKILLLGDTEETAFMPKELAYYDQKGGYNLDFNYRDSQRTKVTEETTNILINVDGIYDITPELVDKTLSDAVNLITGCCGGKVEFSGVVI